MRFNSSPVNDVAINDIAPRETFEGIFGRFYQSVSAPRAEGVFADLQQSVGLARAEAIFAILDQEVQLRLIVSSGTHLACFYQDVQKTTDEHNFITFDQKVIE